LALTDQKPARNTDESSRNLVSRRALVVVCLTRPSAGIAASVAMVNLRRQVFCEIVLGICWMAHSQGFSSRCDLFCLLKFSTGHGGLWWSSFKIGYLGAEIHQTEKEHMFENLEHMPITGVRAAPLDDPTLGCGLFDRVGGACVLRLTVARCTTSQQVLLHSDCTLCTDPAPMPAKWMLESLRGEASSDMPHTIERF
jgi:hypothetical protein